jgi:hypothetical protein
MKNGLAATNAIVGPLWLAATIATIATTTATAAAAAAAPDATESPSSASAPATPRPSAADCHTMSGCPESQPTHDIGRGALITLPAGWSYNAYPMPPDPEGLTNIRIRKPGFVIAITGFPNLDGRAFPEPALREMLVKGVDQYRAASVERETRFVSVSDEEGTGTCASFTATEGTQPFNVLPNTRTASVTSCLLARHRMVFSISLSSDRGPDGDYAEAVKAIQHIE